MSKGVLLGFLGGLTLDQNLLLHRPYGICLALLQVLLVVDEAGHVFLPRHVHVPRRVQFRDNRGADPGQESRIYLEGGWLQRQALRLKELLLEQVLLLLLQVDELNFDTLDSLVEGWLTNLQEDRLLEPLKESVSLDDAADKDDLTSEALPCLRVVHGAYRAADHLFEVHRLLHHHVLGDVVSVDRVCSSSLATYERAINPRHAV